METFDLRPTRTHPARGGSFLVAALVVWAGCTSPTQEPRTAPPVAQAQPAPKGGAMLRRVVLKVLTSPNALDVPGQPREFTELGYREATVEIDAKKTRCTHESVVRPPYGPEHQRQLAAWAAIVEAAIQRSKLEAETPGDPYTRNIAAKDVKLRTGFLASLKSGDFPPLTCEFDTYAPNWEGFNDARIIGILASRRFEHPYPYFKDDANSRVTVTLETADGKSVTLTYPETYVYPGNNPAIKSTFPDDVKAYLAPLGGHWSQCLERLREKALAQP